MIGPGDEDELGKGDVEQKPFDPPQKMRTVKAKEIAEVWPYDVEIPADVELDDALRLYLYQIVPTEEEGKSPYNRIHFPSDGPSFLGLTNDEIKAAGGDGDYFIRLYDKLGTKWIGSKTVIIGQSYRQPHQKRTLGTHVQEVQEPVSQEEEKPKEEDDMNEFAKEQLEKNEAKIGRLENELRTALKEASDNKLEAIQAQSNTASIEAVAKESEKRTESEKVALEKEIGKLEAENLRLTGEAAKITGDYEQRLNSETKRIETDHASKVEGLRKEILELKDLNHKMEKENDKMSFAAILKEAKGSGGGGENNSVMMAEILKHSFDYEGQKLKIHSEERKDERDIAREIELAKIENSTITPDEDTPDPETPTPPQTGGTGVGKVVESLLKGGLGPVQEWLSKVGLIVKSPEDIEALKQEYMTAGAEMAEKKIMEAIEEERKKAAIKEQQERIAADKKAASDKKAAAKKKDAESPKEKKQAEPKDPEKPEKK
jgi:hypothetical protein